ncbi:MAG TPA: 2-C-methyl-D-erythritol 4-phosphate cytidylyltransferase [Gemmatimonadales bacterium]|nr:2-C-methyl-D-erythritol 4-phosphate cytidylyltransferase [Gemmatimonadales bacterium]
MPRDVGVVVVAAGRGTRLGGEVPKQYLEIGGVPVLLRAVRPFAGHPEVAQVVVVLAPAEVERPPGFLAPLAGPALTIVAGGRERADSVAAGLAALAGACEIVLVHDGARPFVDRGVIDAVIAHARAGDGAVAAVPVSDTIKEEAPDDPTRVGRTVARERLWRAQTPQGFPRRVLEQAYARAAAGAAGATDDASLVEACGAAVRLVPDTPRNLKITTREDLAVAEALAGAER